MSGTFVRAIFLGFIASMNFLYAGSGIETIPRGEEKTFDAANEAYKARRYGEAVAILEKVIQSHPNSLSAWSWLGLARLDQGKYPEAQRALERALAIDSNDVRDHYLLGMVKYNTKDFDGAIKCCRDALALKSDDPSARLIARDVLIKSLEASGRYAEAEKERKKDLPDYPPSIDSRIRDLENFVNGKISQ